MNKQAAHAFLDAVRNGVPAKPWEITDALHATGDLSRHQQLHQQRVASHQFPFYATETGKQPENTNG